MESKNFQKDVHIKPIFPIYIIEGCERLSSYFPKMAIGMYL